MTRERLNAAAVDAIELRLREATPGPWEAPPYRTSPDGPASYNSVTSEHANICGLHDGGQTRDRIDANARFIAAMPSDAESLLAEVSACWEERERLTAALRAVRKIKSDHKHHGCDEEVLDLVNNALKKCRLDALREPQHSTACSMNAAVRLGADCICGALREPQEDAR